VFFSVQKAIKVDQITIHLYNPRSLQLCQIQCGWPNSLVGGAGATLSVRSSGVPPHFTKGTTIESFCTLSEKAKAKAKGRSNGNVKESSMGRTLGWYCSGHTSPSPADHAKYRGTFLRNPRLVGG
jgi:hypothetical protein